MLNFSTYSDDLEQYSSQKSFLEMLRGFDGVELIHCGEGYILCAEKTAVFLSFYEGFYYFGAIMHVYCVALVRSPGGVPKTPNSALLPSSKCSFTFV